MPEETPQTFADKFRSGGCVLDDVDDYVGAWHSGHGEPGQSLADFLGLTESQYRAFAENPASLAWLLRPGDTVCHD